MLSVGVGSGFTLVNALSFTKVVFDFGPCKRIFPNKMKKIPTCTRVLWILLKEFYYCWVNQNENRISAEK